MKRTSWILIAAALLTCGLGMHLIVTEPLQRQITSLSTEVDDLQGGMQQVADFRDEVAGTNDLLSGLVSQSRRIDQARAAIDNIARFEREVRQQSTSSTNALAALHEIARLDREVRRQSAASTEALAALSDVSRLQNDVIEQSRKIGAVHGTLDELAKLEQRAGELSQSAQEQAAGLDAAEESLRQLGDFQQRVAIQSSGIEIAENRFGRLIELRNAIEQVQPTTIDAASLKLAELDALIQQVVEKGQQATEAREISGQLIALQDEIVARGTRTNIARKHAEQLLNLEDTLANDAGRDVAAATKNLATLLEIEEQLAAQDEQLAAAVESLELMQDLQGEFVRRSQELESIRRGLTELIMMESLVARTVRSLQPLIELTDLRRLDAEQLRTIARSMTQGSEQRTATNDPKTPGATHRIHSADVEVIDPSAALVPVPPAE